jgi:DNA polymerase
VRRWFELQRDLGGDELVLDTPMDVAAALAQRDAPARSGAAAAPQPPPAAMSAPRAVVAEPRVMPVADDDGATGWRKGAPPIPGPGYTVTQPANSPLTGTSAWDSLDAMAQMIAGCVKCPLCQGRTNAVPGEGNPEARLMLVGEGPGESEDLSGRPFVGRAGELLDKILESIEMPRATVFIANVVKCRPPRNRAPLPEERDACMPYLRRQIALVNPDVILALGSTAAEALLGMKRPLGELRLKVHLWDGIPLVVTYHPAALLRNPNWKRPAWDDVRIARQLLDRHG